MDPKFSTKVEVLEYGAIANWQLAEYEGLYVPVKIKCPICGLLSTAIPFDCSGGNIGNVTPLMTKCRDCDYELLAFIYLYEAEILHCDLAWHFFGGSAGKDLEDKR